MSNQQFTTQPAQEQAPPSARTFRKTAKFVEYVRLFQAAGEARGMFITYFWHTLGELDQCLTPLVAYFGDRWKRAISPDDMAGYVAMRRDQGISKRAIHQELSTLDAMIQYAGKRRRGRGYPSLPSRKFLKRPEAKQAAPAGERDRREAPVWPQQPRTQRDLAEARAKQSKGE